MKNKKTLLKELTKANKSRRLKIAQREGFATVESYREFLTNGIGVDAPNLVKEENTFVAGDKSPYGEKQHIVHVFCVDASSSMSGPNAKACVNGMKRLYNDIIEQDNPQLSQSLVVVEFHSWATVLQNTTGVENMNNEFIQTYNPRGTTAMNDGILKGIELAEKISANRYIVTILTDGNENNSKASMGEVREIINQKNQDGRWNFALLGSGMYMENYGQIIGIYEDNILKVENTEAGFTRSFDAYSRTTKAVYTATLDKQEIDNTSFLVIDKQ